jgi:hypothetical protein
VGADMNDDQHRKEMFKQANQAAIEFSKTMLYSSFLLNGAAATALLASRTSAFYCSAVLFGFGSLSAIIGLGVSYLYILLLGETWRQRTSSYEAKEIKIYFLNKAWLMSCKDIEFLRLVPISCAAASVFLFIVAMVWFVVVPWPS